MRSLVTIPVTMPVAMLAAALAPLLGAGCARLVRVEVVQPLALADLPADSRRLVVAIDGARAARERAIDPDIEDRLAAVVTAALVERGELRIVPAPRSVHEPWTAAVAPARARAAGAELVVLLRLTHFDARSGVHHVRRYWDASGSAEAAIFAASGGHVLRSARARSTASARTEYASREWVEDLLLEDLGKKVAGDLLLRRTGRFVALAHPADGSQRQAIELAVRGEWRQAAEVWRAHLAARPGDEAAAHNLRVAEGVLGSAAASGGPASDSERRGE